MDVSISEFIRKPWTDACWRDVLREDGCASILPLVLDKRELVGDWGVAAGI